MSADAGDSSTSGFPRIVRLLPARRRAFSDGVRAPAAALRLAEVGGTQRLLAYQLTSPVETHGDFAALTPQPTEAA